MKNLSCLLAPRNLFKSNTIMTATSLLDLLPKPNSWYSYTYMLKSMIWFIYLWSIHLFNYYSIHCDFWGWIKVDVYLCYFPCFITLNLISTQKKKKALLFNLCLTILKSYGIFPNLSVNVIFIYLIQWFLILKQQWPLVGTD